MPTDILGNFVTSLKGFAFKSSWFEESGVPVAKVTDFTGDSIDLSASSRLPIGVAERFGKYSLCEGDVILQTVGSWPSNPDSVVGKCVRVPKNAQGALLNQNAVRLSPLSGLDNTYLFYLLRSPKFRGYVIGNARGSASQASITLESIKAFAFDLPSMDTQVRVADTLARYDRLIENSQRQISLLEEAAKLIFREWFIRLRFPGHEHAKIENGVPADWYVGALGQVAEVVRGRSYKGSELSESQGRDFVNLKCFVRYGGFRESGLKKYTGPFKEAQCVQPGDIVMAVTDMTQERMIVAQAAWIPRTVEAGAVISMDVVRINPSPETSKLWLYYFLRYSGFSGLVSQYGTGATVVHLSPRLIELHSCIVPSAHLQEAFSEVIAPIRYQIDVLLTQIQTLVKARDLLLPRLMSGEIEV